MGDLDEKGQVLELARALAESFRWNAYCLAPVHYWDIDSR